ncbi:hypothetical protein AB205_0005800 [Aquarana catesbeiana]|uniref:Uncharacterized protein n=1 Tax=Aquarana catesbeiana TaxID=8400 RepID=A0A2G9SM62_AQUCT|nr:hypothetical protein AB205_0005800 [Aquarana catesbeiana]
MCCQKILVTDLLLSCLSVTCIPKVMLCSTFRETPCNSNILRLPLARSPLFLVSVCKASKCDLCTSSVPNFSPCDLCTPSVSQCDLCTPSVSSVISVPPVASSVISVPQVFPVSPSVIYVPPVSLVSPSMISVLPVFPGSPSVIFVPQVPSVSQCDLCIPSVFSEGRLDSIFQKISFLSLMPCVPAFSKTPVNLSNLHTFYLCVSVCSESHCCLDTPVSL